MKTDTLQDSLEKYRQKIAGGGRNKAAAYEACPDQWPQLQAGRPDQLLCQGDPRKVAAYEAAKLVTDFDPNARDENTDYYIAKLADLVKKFADVTETAASSSKQGSLAH